MACWATPDEDTLLFLFPSAAIALGPKPIPPLKALGAWEASSLNSSSRLQSVASELRTSMQEARVGGLRSQCVLVGQRPCLCVPGMCACAGQRPCLCVPRVTSNVCLKCEPVRCLGAGSIWTPICFHNILVGRPSCFCLCPVEMRGSLCRQPASLQSWL